MKFISTLLFASLALAQNAAIAQPTPAKPAAHAHATTAAHASAGGCVKLPDLGPKFPALPAGSPCAKALYTITTAPTVKLVPSGKATALLTSSLPAATVVPPV